MLIESNIIKLINPGSAVTQTLPMPEAIDKDLTINVLRLDLVHPVISGNKFFKLKYFLEQAVIGGRKGIISFGGAWSNHLVALALACQHAGLESIGLIRGEAPPVISAMLEEARSYGMELHFTSRERYQDKDGLANEYSQRYPDFDIVPEGGRSETGVRGAAEILSLTDAGEYDLITCAVGTGTMLAGLLSASGEQQKVLGFSSLKMSQPNDVAEFITRTVPGRAFAINYDFHFGGYAKYTPDLIDFMNELWKEYALPTDFVYTAKMIFGLRELVANGHFAAGTRILAIQSGGLQGNRSLKDELIF